MTPNILDNRLGMLLGKCLDKNALLVYGGCHPTIYSQKLQASGVSKMSGVNCIWMFVGKIRYRRLLEEKAFCLLPEWANKWRQRLFTICYLESKSTIEIFQTSHSKVVYIGTVVTPILGKYIKGCSEYFSLPYEILDISLDNFLNLINKTSRELTENEQ